MVHQDHKVNKNTQGFFDFAPHGAAAFIVISACNETLSEFSIVEKSCSKI
jgi:hypothetical protein